jgi:serralysin
MASLIGNGRGNVIIGTDAADLIDGRGGGDVIRGEGGNDRVLGGAGDDAMIGGPGRDQVRGGTGNDDIADTFGRNTVLGEAGDDNLFASGVVDGGPGDDRITAFYRESLLTGGSGADTFALGVLFGTAPTPDPGNADLIADFDRGEGDRLEVRDARPGADGRVDFVGTGPLTGEAQVRYEVRDGDTFVLVNGDDVGEPTGTADFVFRLDGAFRLTEDDFILS